MFVYLRSFSASDNCMILSRFKWAMLSIAVSDFPLPLSPSFTGKLILWKTEHFQIVFAPSSSRILGYGCNDKNSRCVIGAYCNKQLAIFCFQQNIFVRSKDDSCYTYQKSVGIKKNKFVSVSRDNFRSAVSNIVLFICQFNFFRMSWWIPMCGGLLSV